MASGGGGTGSTIGGLAGGVGGSFFGPVGGMLGGAAGSMLGGMFDKKGNKPAQYAPDPYANFQPQLGAIETVLESLDAAPWREWPRCRRESLRGAGTAADGSARGSRGLV